MPRATAIREYKRLTRLLDARWLTENQKSALARRAALIKQEFNL